jgi:hypothetical protein
MRMIIEDRDGLSGAFYANLQERADQLDGLVPIGDQTDGHVTILAIETEGGTFGWLKGTVPGEEARALRLAAAVLAGELDVSNNKRARIIAYLGAQAELLDRAAAQLESQP